MSQKIKQQNIPEGWSVDLVDNFATIKTGDKDTQNRVKDGDYPFFVRSHNIERINSYGFDGEAVLTSGDGVGVGKIYHYIRGKFDYHQRVYNIHNFREDVLGKYFYLTFSKHFYRRVMSMSAKNSVDSVRREMISKMPILLPSVKEQKQIVKVLETWDEAIDKLGEVIALKREVKKGLMQKLLTGELRLPGFKGEWRESDLGDLVKIYDGTHQTPKYVESGIPFYSTEHLTSGDFSKTKFVSEEVYDHESRRVKIEKGDVLMSRIGNIGAVKFVDWQVKASFYVTLALMKAYGDIDAEFLSFYINSDSFKRELWKRTLHVAFPNKINLGAINECRVDIPVDIWEQKEIASVLRTADKEITALQQKRNRLLDQKKYLLNNLVTGQIRTPENL